MKPVSKARVAAAGKASGPAPPAARPAPKPSRSMLEVLGDPVGGANFRRINRMLFVAAFILVPVDYAVFKINGAVVEHNDGRILSVTEAVSGAIGDLAQGVDDWRKGARTAARKGQAAAHVAETGLHSGQAALAKLPQAEKTSEGGMRCAAAALGGRPGAPCR